MANLVVRTAGNPAALDPPQTLEHRTAYLTDSPKRAMWLLGLFAALALLLAAGIYGVSACFTAARAREIGVRMALGASFADVAGLVYRGVLKPAAIGLATGFGASFGLMRLLQSLIFGVGAVDPRTLAVSALTLFAVSTLAAAGPALRAARLDPAKALRRD